MDKNNTKGIGLGIFDVVGVVFIILKLCKIIDWSWWWVTAPFWLPAIIVILLSLIMAIIIEGQNKRKLKDENL